MFQFCFGEGLEVLVGTWCFRCWVGCLGVVAAVGFVGTTWGDGRRGLDMMSLSVCASCIGRGSTFGFSSFVVLVSIVSISSLVIPFCFVRILHYSACPDHREYPGVIVN